MNDLWVLDREQPAAMNLHQPFFRIWFNSPNGNVVSMSKKIFFFFFFIQFTRSFAFVSAFTCSQV